MILNLALLFHLIKARQRVSLAGAKGKLSPVKMNAILTAYLSVLIYSGYILIMTLHPFQFACELAHPLPLWQIMYHELTQNLQHYGAVDCLLNVILFVPFGLLLDRAWHSHRASGHITLVTSVVCGGLFSFIIELTQICLPVRTPAAFDVVANALGTGGGALVYRWYLAHLASKSRPHRVSMNLLVCVALVYSALPFIFASTQFPWPTFRNWNAHFPFQIGNEATLERPWLGKIYLVAIYNRALTEAEIEQHLRAGYTPQGRSRRTTKGLIALYTFDENGGLIVYDRSGFQAPLNLTLSPASHIRWLRDSPGLHLWRPALISSQGSTWKLYHALASTHAMTLEVWLAPETTQQHGPARILSFSANNGERNFTLGQEGANLHFRLRTSATGKNGSPLNLATTDGFLTTKMHQVVTTYREGLEQLYINGKVHSNHLNLNRDIILGFATRNGRISQVAYSFFYFFPVTLVLSFVFSRLYMHPLSAVCLATMIGASLISLTELGQALMFEREMDWMLIGNGVVVEGIGAVSGVIFYRGEL